VRMKVRRRQFIKALRAERAFKGLKDNSSARDFLPKNS
jgi:hypothetical protein